MGLVDSHVFYPILHQNSLIPMFEFPKKASVWRPQFQHQCIVLRKLNSKTKITPQPCFQKLCAVNNFTLDLEIGCTSKGVSAVFLQNKWCKT